MLQIRYHPKFKGTDTLLFAGSRKDIDRLRSCFLGWNGEDLDLIENLKSQEEVFLFSIGQLHLRRDRLKSSLILIHDTPKGDIATWFVPSTYQRTYVGVLDLLLEDDRPGQQRLDDVGPGHVQVVVSKDEPPLSGSGKAIERFVLSKKGITFSAESVAVLRTNVKSCERDKIVPCLDIGIERNRQIRVGMGGSHIVKPGYIMDQLEDTTFYWHTDRLDELREKYFVDLEFQRKSYLIPLPEK